MVSTAMLRRDEAMTLGSTAVVTFSFLVLYSVSRVST